MYIQIFIIPKVPSHLLDIDGISNINIAIFYKCDVLISLKKKASWTSSGSVNVKVVKWT